jgi:hypothetical protein
VTHPATTPWSHLRGSRRPRTLVAAGAALGVAAGLSVAATATATASASGTPAPAIAASGADHYAHVFVIVEENNGFSDIIGNPAAPNLNRLAQTYGLATAYYGVSHPSEPNYVAMLGGSTFGIADDNPYYTHPVTAPNLISQLDGAHVPWKAYLQSTPTAGFEGMCYPARCDGAPDSDPTFAMKHNGIPVFTRNHDAADWARQVPYTQLATDLRSGRVPAFGYIIPDECHDMHGDPPFCLDSGNTFDPQNQHLVSTGDQFLGRTVAAITSASFWSKGNNAIVVTYDEGDDNDNGGGQVPTVVITSHGPRHFEDASFYNHYSLLDTVEHDFGVPCLAGACGSGISTMSPLFRVTGAPAEAYRPLADPWYPVPTPVVAEPLRSTGITASAAGWTVVDAPQYGSSNNSPGAIASSGPDNVWAVGDFLPDAASPNQDATLPLTEHYDGHRWSVVPTPNAGSNYGELYGVAVDGAQAWTVGTDLNARFQTNGLLEHYSGTAWHVVPTPQPGALRTLFYGVSAISPRDVWVVGTRQAANGAYRTLTEHFDGSRWQVVPAADPGDVGDTFYAVTAVSADDVYAVGQRIGATPSADQALVEHWNGHAWSVVSTPAHAGTTALMGVATSAGQVYAVGSSQDPTTGMSPVVLTARGGVWRYAKLPSYTSRWTYLLGVTSYAGKAVAVGTDYDVATGNQVPVLLTGSGETGWRAVDGPNPSGGKGGDILGGATYTGRQVWVDGMFDTGGNHMALLQHN